MVRARGSIEELRAEASLGARTGWIVARAFDFLEEEESGEAADPTDDLVQFRSMEPRKEVRFRILILGDQDASSTSLQAALFELAAGLGVGAEVELWRERGVRGGPRRVASAHLAQGLRLRATGFAELNVVPAVSN